eukprot:7377020-Prymnesium_polylepis.1
MRLGAFSIAEARCLRRAMKGDVRGRQARAAASAAPAPTCAPLHGRRSGSAAARAAHSSALGPFGLVTLNHRQQAAQQAASERRQQIDQLHGSLNN